MNRLTAELNAFMASMMDRIDSATAEVLNRNYERLDKSGIAGRAIGVGDAAPDFTLPDQEGKSFSLSVALRHGPVVALFVRGGWCPFCSITMRAFNDARASLTREGASLVAISPAMLPHIQTTAECNILRYPVLSDAGLAVAASYGLVWELPPDMQAIYRRFGHDLPHINGTGDWRLPIPAGYVIGTDGIVHAAHVDTRLTSRLLPSEALEAVKALAATPVA